MATLPSFSGAELIATLTKIGFIGKGLLLKILRDAEITKEELNRLLE